MECYGPLWLWLKQYHAKKKYVGFKGNLRTDIRKTCVRHIKQVANLSCCDYFDYPWRQVSVKLNIKNVGKTFTAINDLLKYTFCWSLASGFKKQLRDRTAKTITKSHHYIKIFVEKFVWFWSFWVFPFWLILFFVYFYNLFLKKYGLRDCFPILMF